VQTEAQCLVGIRAVTGGAAFHANSSLRSQVSVSGLKSQSQVNSLRLKSSDFET